MKQLLYISLLVVTFGVGMMSCDKAPEPLSQEIQVDAFHSLDVSHFLDVVLVQDSVFYLESIGSEKYISKLSFEVEDSVLYVNNDASFTWLNPKSKRATLIVHAPDFKQVVMHSSGNLSNIDTLQLNELVLSFTGKHSSADLTINADVFAFWNNNPNGGQINLHGTCDHIKTWVFALINIDAVDLQAREATVFHSSRGYLNVNAYEKVRYTIQNEGNFNLYGNPGDIQLLEPNTGTGKLTIH